MKTKKTTSLPGSQCDICRATCDKVIIDAPTTHGPWAHMCERCAKKVAREPMTKFVLTDEVKQPVDRQAIRDHAYSLSKDELSDSIVPTACPNGCEVEPDGKCCHGYPSPLLVLGLI